MPKLTSFKRDEHASNVTKIILVVWLLILGMNREKLFNPIDLVPVEIEQADESRDEYSVVAATDVAQ